MVVEVANLLVDGEEEEAVTVDEEDDGETEARREDDIEGRICMRV